ncbi:MAG: TraR/DksA C4-type zinc finger protein [Gemmataceae bacterium]
MNPERLNACKERLETLVERHGGQAAGLRREAAHGLGGESGGGISNAPTHQADLGTAHHEEEVGILLMENQELLLAECQAALSRLKAGTYGLCERCFRQIPDGRLEAFPHARYCVPCAEIVESNRDYTA